jgi:hypothetical protein
MHVLRGKLVELVRMEQDPLRVFPRAHFPRRWRGPRTIKKHDFVCANLLVEPEIRRHVGIILGSVLTIDTNCSFDSNLAMPRQLRIQYEGAVYHLMSRVIGVRRFFAMIWIEKIF